MKLPNIRYTPYYTTPTLSICYVIVNKTEDSGEKKSVGNTLSVSSQRMT